jgi:hypothetical protein
MVWTITGTAFNPTQANFGVTPASNLTYGPGIYDFTFGTPAPTQPTPVDLFPNFVLMHTPTGEPWGWVNMDQVAIIRGNTQTTGSTILVNWTGFHQFDIQESPLGSNLFGGKKWQK